MEKVWLQSYQEGVPAEINENAYSSIVEVFEQSVEKYAHRPAMENMGKQLTYQELDRLTLEFAAFLQNKLGTKKGEKVALMMPNILQYPVALFGTLRAGFTVVNVNPLYTARELKHQLNDSGAKVLVIVENFAKTFQEIADETSVEHVITTEIGDMQSFIKAKLVNFVIKHVKKMVPDFHLERTISFKRALKIGEASTYKRPDLNLQDVAFLQYTGGTTGVSKGATLTHGNIIGNLEQCWAFLAPLLEPGKEVVITALPLYHIFSLTANCLVFTKAGGLNYLITNPRDMPGFVKELKRVNFTALTGVNTLFNGLLNTPGFDSVDFSRFKLALGGGMAVQRAVAEKWQAVTGKPLLEAYGLTETSPAVCINPMNLEAYNGTIGVPIPSTEVSVRNDDDEEMGFGEEGELCVKGPQVMTGYWQRPEETAKVMTDDGFFRTGDMATIDEKGFVRIVDRKKDMILVSGFNVYPNEIEDVLAGHEKVLEVAAVGIPSESSGEVVKVFVVRKDSSLNEEELIAFAKKNLTGYKVPKAVEFMEELPKTNVGKILRRELRDTSPA